MRFYALLTLLAMLAACCSATDFHVRRQPSPNMVDQAPLQHTQSSTQRLPATKPDPTLVPDTNPGMLVSSETGDAGRATARTAFFVGIVGVLFGLGMGM